MGIFPPIFLPILTLTNTSFVTFIAAVICHALQVSDCCSSHFSNPFYYERTFCVYDTGKVRNDATYPRWSLWHSHCTRLSTPTHSRAQDMVFFLTLPSEVSVLKGVDSYTKHIYCITCILKGQLLYYACTLEGSVNKKCDVTASVIYCVTCGNDIYQYRQPLPQLHQGALEYWHPLPVVCCGKR